MANQISIIIKAQDNASQKIRQLGSQIESTGKKSDEAGRRIFQLKDHLGALAAIAGGAGAATYGLLNFMGKSIGAANRLDSALTGLNSVASAFGSDASAAKKAAQELASDGLMTVADSATGLKNLLASGFNLDQAVTLMKRFKDSAAFGRQASLSFGDAISSATEGIKNGNSILVDNAGVTKNLSLMLQEAGYSSQDLMKASSDAGVRQAIFNGILKETNAQAGDSARLSESAAGKQAQWNAQTQELYQRIGTSLQPALVSLLEVAAPLVETIADWVSKNPELTSGIVIAGTALFGLIGTASGVGLAIGGLKPIFALFKATSNASIGSVSGKFSGLKSLVGKPIVMPAIAIGAAMIAIQMVWDKYQETMRAIEAGQRAIKTSQDATENLRQQYERAKASGDKGKAKKLFNAYMNALDSDIAILNQQANNKPMGIAKMLGWASGTNAAPGGWSLVGEHGPEVVRLPQGAQVTPSYRTRQDGAGGGRGVVIEHFEQHIHNQMDSDRAMRDLGFALELAS